jgi:Tfp pilus assembly protein PilX
VVLFIALIVLVAMTLAGLAMFRSVGTGVIVAGNLAFKQAATAAGDRGLEFGRDWLRAQAIVTLQTTAAPLGYYSDWQNTPGNIFDPIRFIWSDATSFPVTLDDGGGNQIRYVIHRLCAVANVTVNAPGQQCVTRAGGSSGGSKGGGSYGVTPLKNTIQVYYRVTVRVMGPKNTISYVQSVTY